MKSYKRFEDGSSVGAISVTVSKDGEVWVEILSKSDPSGLNPILRFGGQSPRTRDALLVLAEEIRLDNEEKPQHRGG